MALRGLWLFRIGVIVPPLLLAFLALPRLTSGLVLDAAFPVPVQMEMNVPLPEPAYQAALDILSDSDREDGDTWIARAEAAALLHDPAALHLVDEGLSRVPASARGWMLFAESAKDAEQRAAGLELALALSPYDYWLPGRKALAGMVLWDRLSEAGRGALLRETQRLWTEPSLRVHIVPLLASEEGAVLMTRAFAGAPDSLREMNRWVARTRWQRAVGR